MSLPSLKGIGVVPQPKPLGFFEVLKYLPEELAKTFFPKFYPPAKTFVTEALKDPTNPENIRRAFAQSKAQHIDNINILIQERTQFLQVKGGWSWTPQTGLTRYRPGQLTSEQAKGIATLEERVGSGWEIAFFVPIGRLKAVKTVSEKTLSLVDDELRGLRKIAQEMPKGKIPFGTAKRIAELEEVLKTKKILQELERDLLRLAKPTEEARVLPKKPAMELPKISEAELRLPKPSKLPEFRTPKIEATTVQVGQAGETLPPIPPEGFGKILPSPEGLPSSEELVNKVVKALEEAKPIRAKQEQIFREERAIKVAKAKAMGEKVKGEAGFYAELSALKGEMTKVQFESIKGKLGQSDINALFIQIKDSPSLRTWDKISARLGLARMLEGRVPTENQLVLLNKVFGSKLVDALLAKKDLLSRMSLAGMQIANIPRALMSSFDLSAPLRQGLFLIRRQKQFFHAFLKMFKAFGSEKSYKLIMDEIYSRPSHELMQDAKLALTEMDSILLLREERFMSSWAEKIPVAGKIVRASGRAYTAFLNLLRADVFDDLLKTAKRVGRDPEKDFDLVKGIANYINVATGRGSVGKFERAAMAFNAVFFSPRLMFSRLTLLNPYYYIKADPFVRKEALKDLFALAGAGLTIITLAKMGGAEVEGDPRSSDFLKEKIGNTRIDHWGGFQQYLVLFARLITGKMVSSTTGKESVLGEGFRGLTRLDIIIRTFLSKESPVASFITDLLRGENLIGQPVSISGEIVKRFTPMVVQDLIDIAKDDPDLLPLGLSALFGVGVQTYGGEKPLRKSVPRRPIPSLKGIGL